MMLLSGSAMAQPVPISSEDVAPLPNIGTRPVVVVSPAALPLTPALPVLATMPAASPTSIASYFVPGLVVELPAVGISSTLRDMALVQAAREGLGRVLANAEPPLDIATQTRLVQAARDPMGLVKDYRIAEEVLNPSYTLTVDMTYRPEAVMALLEVKPEPPAQAAAPVTLADALAVSASVSETAAPVPGIVLRVNGNAAAQDRVMKTLRAQGLPAVYSRITVEGAEMNVPNANADTLAAQLRAKGMAVDVAADGGVDVHF
ncbi:MAG TPA: hypothetical protein VHP58_02210 [Alphaproteobacteria bacterium]|nr:hypothetical protein [Alphaproteobacteria bacterium]